MKELHKKIRLWLCRRLYWHRSSVVTFSMNDPLLQGYSSCRYCGHYGAVDSQGNFL